MRYNILILLILIPLASACNKFSNRVEHDVVVCGPNTANAGDYLVAHDPSGRQLDSSELEVYSLETRLQSQVLITAKGCLQLKASGHLLVKAKGKPWVARVNQDSGVLQLKEAEEQNLTVNCSPQKRVNSQVMIDQLLDFSQVKDPEAFLIESALSNANARLVYAFDKANAQRLLPEPIAPGEYHWEVTITDIFRSVRVKQECQLIIDDKAPDVVVRAESMPTLVHDGISFYQIDRNQRLQFFDGAKTPENDLAFIEYCTETFNSFTEFKAALDRVAGPTSCEHPIRTESLQTQITSSNSGFSLVHFRAVDAAGNDTGWRKPVPLLFYHGEEMRVIEALSDKELTLGLLTRPMGPKKLLEKVMTAIRMGAALPTDFERSQARRHLMESVPFVLGQLPPFLEIAQIPQDSTITTFTISPDGDQIAVGLGNGKITRWSSRDGRVIAGPLPDHKVPINTLDFDPSGRLLVSSDSNGFIQIWNLEKGVPEADSRLLTNVDKFSPAYDRVESLLFVPGTHQLALGMYSGTLRIWDWQKGPAADIFLRVPPPNSATTHPYDSSITKLALLDDKTLLSVNRYGVVDFWDIPNKSSLGPSIQPLTNWNGDGGVHLSEDKSKLLFWSNGWNNGAPEYWDAVRREKIEQPLDRLKFAKNLAFFRGENHLLALENRKLQLYSHPYTMVQQTLIENYGGTFALAPDNKNLLTSQVFRTLSVWTKSQANGEVLLTATSADGHNMFTSGAAVDPDETKLVAVEPSGEIVLIDMKLQKTLRRFTIEWGDFPSSVALSPDGSMLAVGCQNGKIHLIDLTSESDAITLLGQQSGEVSDVAFFDHRTLISNGGSIQIWDIKTRTRQDGPDAFRDGRSFLLYDHNQKMVYSTPQDIRFWDLAQQKPIEGTVPYNALTTENMALTVNPSATLLAFSNAVGEAIQLYDLRTHKLVNQKFEGFTDGPAFVSALQFASDDLLISTVGGLIKLWKIDESKALWSVNKPDDIYLSRFIGPLKDGRLLSYSRDGWLRQWTIDPWLLGEDICKLWGAFLPEHCT